MRTEARFPRIAPQAGHYESFYIKATRPEGGQSIWIRHTVHRRPGEEPTAALWVTLFDADAPAPVATKQRFPAAELAVPEDAYVRVGDAVLAPGGLHGSATSESLAASWDLSFHDDGDPLRHLPLELLYRTKLPRTKLLSPYPSARFSGSFEIGERRLELDGWPGMVGHNWGAEHAEEWVWIQAADLGGRRGDYIDVAAGRVKVGRFTTPWVANGQLVLEGEPLRLGRRIYGTEVDAAAGRCTFSFPGRGITVKGQVSAPLERTVAWVYADPKPPRPGGGDTHATAEHNVLNCSISDIELKVERPYVPHAWVEQAGGAAYELGTRDTAHGVPLQPYPDG